MGDLIRIWLRSLRLYMLVQSCRIKTKIMNYEYISWNSSYRTDNSRVLLSSVKYNVPKQRRWLCQIQASSLVRQRNPNQPRLFQRLSTVRHIGKVIAPMELVSWRFDRTALWLVDACPIYGKICYWVLEDMSVCLWRPSVYGRIVYMWPPQYYIPDVQSQNLTGFFYLVKTKTLLVTWSSILVLLVLCLFSLFWTSDWNSCFICEPYEIWMDHCCSYFIVSPWKLPCEAMYFCD
jgi:hypothetical protein